MQRPELRHHRRAWHAGMAAAATPAAAHHPQTVRSQLLPLAHGPGSCCPAHLQQHHAHGRATGSIGGGHSDGIRLLRHLQWPAAARFSQHPGACTCLIDHPPAPPWLRFSRHQSPPTHLPCHCLLEPGVKLHHGVRRHRRLQQLSPASPRAGQGSASKGARARRAHSSLQHTQMSVRARGNKELMFHAWLQGELQGAACPGPAGPAPAHRS
jgi:hypothetical protein